MSTNLEYQIIQVVKLQFLLRNNLRICRQLQIKRLKNDIFQTYKLFLKTNWLILAKQIFEKIGYYMWLFLYFTKHNWELEISPTSFH